MHIVRRGRLGGLIQEYAQVAQGGTVSGTHMVLPITTTSRIRQSTSRISRRRAGRQATGEFA